MAEQRVTQEDVLSITQNADAKARVTAFYVLTITPSATRNASDFFSQQTGF